MPLKLSFMLLLPLNLIIVTPYFMLSLSSSLPSYNLFKISAARLVCKTRKFDHVNPTFVELHWLPIKYRIVFKILLLVYKSLNVR